MSQVAKAAKKAVQDGLQDYAYLIAPIVARDEQSVTIRYKAEEAVLPLASRAACYGMRSALQLPMLGIFKINEIGQVVESYALPIYSERIFCLVDSNEERSALPSLLELGAHLDGSGVEWDR
jgi:hypothetical protein